VRGEEQRFGRQPTEQVTDPRVAGGRRGDDVGRRATGTGQQFGDQCTDAVHQQPLEFRGGTGVGPLQTGEDVGPQGALGVGRAAFRQDRAVAGQQAPRQGGGAEVEGEGQALAFVRGEV
jgi:hypothetical protein